MKVKAPLKERRRTFVVLSCIFHARKRLMRPHMCRDFGGFSGLLADDSAPFVPEFCLLLWGGRNHLSDADDAELSNVLLALVSFAEEAEEKRAPIAPRRLLILSARREILICS